MPQIKPIFQTNINKILDVQTQLSYSRKMDKDQTIVFLSVENDKKLDEVVKLLGEAINKLSEII